MTRARARHTSLSFAAAVYAVALSCIAAEPSLPVASARLDLDADAACTTRAELVARVHARSPRVQFVDDGSELAIQVQVSTASPGVFAGDISFASSGTKPSLRHVRAHSCSELADAIALIVAVTLDPTAVGPNSKTLTTTDTGTPRGAAAATNTPAAEVSAPATRPKTTAASATETLPVDDGRESNHSRFHPTWGAQLAAGAMAGAAPGVMPGVALFALAGAEQRSDWSPAAVLGVHHAWRTVDEQGGQASFLLDAVTLDACPLRFRLGIFDARPCASLLAGRMSARATDTTNAAAESHRPFAVIGGAGIVSAALYGGIELSGRIAFGANLVRDSFAFSPATFYSVPPVSGSASVGIGLRWR